MLSSWRVNSSSWFIVSAAYQLCHIVSSQSQLSPARQLFAPMLGSSMGIVHQIPEGHVGVYWRGGALLPTTTEPGGWEDMMRREGYDSWHGGELND